MKMKFWDNPRLDSRITTRNVSNTEKWLGYLFAPLGPFIFNAIVSTYLNVYYTDLLGATAWWNDAFLIIFPIVSKIIDAVTNVLMGILIDRTKTRQGKLRPYILMSAPLLMISGLMLFLIPDMSANAQMIWIMFSYNFYCAVAYTMFFISSNLLVPNASRNTLQRTQLSVFNNISNIAGSGIIVALIFPMAIMPLIGVDKMKWMLIMSIFAALTLPSTVLYYFFTKERVSEEDEGIEEQKVSVAQQIKAMVTEKYWVLIMSFYLIYNLCYMLKNISLPYYCNWVLGTYSDGITQTMVSALGGLPMGIGMLIIWPLAKKFGKKNITAAGLVIYSIGSFICFVSPKNMIVVLIGQFIKNMGGVPISYIFLSLLADILDTIEYKRGLRVDGLSGSVYAVLATVCFGISSGVFNWVLAKTGYAAPVEVSAGVYNVQNELCQRAITWCFVGVEAVAGTILAVMVACITVEKGLGKVTAGLMERKRAQAEAAGIEWIDPVEAAKREEEEAKVAAEEERIRKLREKCQRKGLDFERENARYLKRHRK